MLEHKVIENTSMTIIGAYTIFILSDLTMADSLNFNPYLMAQID